MELENELSPNLWKAIAGSSFQIPTVDSLVYYFPQGHAEQASTAPDFTQISKKLTCSFFLCQIVSVKLLANKETDEVYAKIGLKPIDYHHQSSSARTLALSYGSSSDDNNNSLYSLVRVLSPTAASGHSFPLSREAANTMFPPLNDNLLAQNIILRDVHGVDWKMQHVYSGAKAKHYLRSGWKKFVDDKKLVEGDTVVFIKSSNDELCIGIRRKHFPVLDFGRLDFEGSVLNPIQEFRNREILGFQRNARSRVSAESVLKAVELAQQNCEFEVSWYPKLGWTDFLVNPEIVNESMKMNWTTGLIIKMLVEKEDSNPTWYQGKVSSVGADNGLWNGSPWRMLQVTWDDNNSLQNVTSLSPWQVQVINAPHPPSEKQCASQAEVIPDGSGDFSAQPTVLRNFMIGSSSPSTSPLLCHDNDPTCVKGARHTPIYPSGNNNNYTSYADLVSGHSVSSDTSNVAISLASEFNASLLGNNTNNILFPDNVSGSPLSTEPRSENIGGKLQSDRLSPSSQGKVNPLSNFSSKSTKKEEVKSITLFGQTLSVKQAVETEFGDGESTEVDGGSTDADGGRAEAVGGSEYAGAEG